MYLYLSCTQSGQNKDRGSVDAVVRVRHHGTYTGTDRSVLGRRVFVRIVLCVGSAQFVGSSHAGGLHHSIKFVHLQCIVVAVVVN